MRFSFLIFLNFHGLPNQLPGILYQVNYLHPSSWLQLYFGEMGIEARTNKHKCSTLLRCVALSLKGWTLEKHEEVIHTSLTQLLPHLRSFQNSHMFIGKAQEHITYGRQGSRHLG